MSPPNLYAVITIMSFLVAFPLAGLMEGPRVIEGFQKAISTMEGPKVGARPLPSPFDSA